MVARHDQHGNGHRPERVECPTDRAAVDLVRLEDVSRDDDEAAPFGVGNLAQGADDVDAGVAEPGLGVDVEEMTSHPELPVGRMQESDHDPRVPTGSDSDADTGRGQ